MTTEELTKAFNEAGFDDDGTKLRAFLKPAAVNAAIADYDGQLASLGEKRNAVLGDIQAEQERIVAEREAVRAKLQAAK